MRYGFLKSPTFAVLWLALAMSLIAINDSIFKLLSAELSLFALLVLRGSFSFVWVMLMPATWRSLGRLTRSAWLKQIIRGLMLLLSMIFFFLGLAVLPIADATAIFFAAPLLITVFSALFLAEKVGLFRLGAVLVGLIGVLIIARPGTESFQIASVLPATGAVTYALFQVLTRHLRDDADVFAMTAVTQMVYLAGGFIGIAAVAVLMPDVSDSNAVVQFFLREWRWPTAEQVLLCFGVSFIILNLSFAGANAYSRAEATFVAPFEYTMVPASILLGILIWGEWPDLMSYIGMALIIGAGVFIIFRENRVDESSNPVTEAEPRVG